MICKTNKWTEETGWEQEASSQKFDIVTYYFSPECDNKKQLLDEVKKLYQANDYIGLSTGGEIYNKEALTGSVVVSAVKFEKTNYKVLQFDIAGVKSSFQVGEVIGKELSTDDLKGLMLFADGLHTNGTQLIAGIQGNVSNDTIITGGLAGDNDKFTNTYVGLNETPEIKKIVAVALYGDNIVIGHGSCGGWDNFGPKRKITKAEDNVLYELDGQPALSLYKKYLTEEQVEQLPGSGLLFPLCIHPEDDPNSELVRTIVGVDEEKQGLIFAGEIPEGHTARLMMGSFDRLIDGAATAAEMTSDQAECIVGDRLSMMVSCIGRRLLMGQQTSDEVEAAFETMNEGVNSVGYYSYGEISPHPKTGFCNLHNQTMTITVIGEK